MNLLPSFVPAAAVFLSISAAAGGSLEPPVGAAACSGCYPASSVADTNVPALAGRKAQEIVTQMQAFRSGQRDTTVMDRIAKGYSDTVIEAITEWYRRNGRRRPHARWAGQSTGVNRVGRRGRFGRVCLCTRDSARGAHVIVIGGGFAGATCARQLKRFDPKSR